MKEYGYEKVPIYEIARLTEKEREYIIKVRDEVGHAKFDFELGLISWLSYWELI